jgi:hypothetical protein
MTDGKRRRAYNSLMENHERTRLFGVIGWIIL